MDSWHATFLGLRHLPREVTAFEIEAFYQFSAEECRVIEERRRPELKLALALQIGFLRMSGRLLEAVRIVPPLLWKHLGARFNVAAPDLASLRAMYRRAPTLIEHQQLACETLGFRWLALRSSARHADTTAQVRVQCAELVVVSAGQALDSTDRRDDRAHRDPVRFASS
jgi:hypothetical protein